jgi:hypothetical protein
MDDLRDLESTYQVLIQEEADLEDIEQIMYEPDEYYFSIRRFGREEWDESGMTNYTTPAGRPTHIDILWWETV